MILVLIQPKIKASRIQILYTGFNKAGRADPVIKNKHDTPRPYTEPTYLCRKKKMLEMTKNATPIVIPNFLNDLLSNLSFSTLVQFKFFLPAYVFFDGSLIFFVQ